MLGEHAAWCLRAAGARVPPFCVRKRKERRNTWGELQKRLGWSLDTTGEQGSASAHRGGACQ